MKSKRRMSRKAWERKINNYEVRCQNPDTIYLVQGRKSAMDTARMFEGFLGSSFARKSFTSPIHNGKK